MPLMRTHTHPPSARRVRAARGSSVGGGCWLDRGSARGSGSKLSSRAPARPNGDGLPRRAVWVGGGGGEGQDLHSLKRGQRHTDAQTRGRTETVRKRDREAKRQNRQREKYLAHGVFVVVDAPRAWGTSPYTVGRPTPALAVRAGRRERGRRGLRARGRQGTDGILFSPGEGIHVWFHLRGDSRCRNCAGNDKINGRA